MNKSLTLGFAALALGALTLAACGGDDDDSKTTKKDEPAQAGTANPRQQDQFGDYGRRHRRADEEGLGGLLESRTRVAC